MNEKPERKTRVLTPEQREAKNRRDRERRAKAKTYDDPNVVIVDEASELERLRELPLVAPLELSGPPVEDRYPVKPVQVALTRLQAADKRLEDVLDLILTGKKDPTYEEIQAILQELGRVGRANWSEKHQMFSRLLVAFVTTPTRKERRATWKAERKGRIITGAPESRIRWTREWRMRWNQTHLLGGLRIDPRDVAKRLSNNPGPVNGVSLLDLDKQLRAKNARTSSASSVEEFSKAVDEANK